MAKSKKSNKKKLTARNADRYDLYQQSVQEPEFEVEFFEKAYKHAFGRKPMVLREDFCGTAAVSCQWVRSHPERRAIAVDLDPEPMAWCMAHTLVDMADDQRQRINFVQGDVRDTGGEKAEVLAAQNFSFFCFKQRPELLAYFKAMRKNLQDEGIAVLDMMGGAETYEDNRLEKKKQKGFVYQWEQVRFDPITHDCLFHIHFKFPGGSKMKKAFTYDWRLWSIPEVRELLDEAGFSDSHVYWEGTDEQTGEGDGNFRRRCHAEADPSWICYIVAVR